MSVNTVAVIAGLVACGIAAWLLWAGFGRFAAAATRIAIAIGVAILGYALYFGGQTILEHIFPDARAPNGDIIAYRVDVFSIALLLIIAAMFFLRRHERPDGAF